MTYNEQQYQEFILKVFETVADLRDAYNRLSPQNRIKAQQVFQLISVMLLA